MVFDNGGGGKPRELRHIGQDLDTPPHQNRLLSANEHQTVIAVITGCLIAGEIGDVLGAMHEQRVESGPFHVVENKIVTALILGCLEHQTPVAVHAKL